MTKKLMFLAQSLDNESPDPIELGGKMLQPDDTIRRQQAISLVAAVAQSGTQIFAKKGVRLMELDCRLLLEVPSEQTDNSGRTAPMVYCFEQATVDDHSWQSIAADLSDFAQRIGRTIHPDYLEVQKEAFAALKKKRRMRKLYQFLALSLIILLLVVVSPSVRIYFMNSN